LVRGTLQELGGHFQRLTAALSYENFDRDGSQMLSPGLYVDIGPWCAIF
jgi:hypothetical protein